MVKLLGTNIASGIVPFTSEDSFPTHYSEYGKGGWRETETLEEMSNIPLPRRKIGMAVYVSETDKIYILKGGITNECWVTFESTQVTTFVFTQASSSNRWEINHKLGKFPSVTVVDSAGTTVIGDVQYIDNNNVVIEFSSPFTGKAYLN
jgi:hypothetical protein